MGILTQYNTDIGGIDDSLISKIGNTPLITTAQDLSSAINDHETSIINIIANKVSKSGDTMSGELTFSNTTTNIKVPTRSISYIDGAKGNAGLYAQKVYNQDAWYPAVCLETKGGGSWQIGNYNNEYLEFVYATKANRDSGTNTTTKVSLPNTAGTIALTSHTHGLSMATSSGTNQITLAASTKYQLSAGGSTYIFTTPPNTNTTYSAGTAMSLSGTTFNHSNYGSAGTAGTSSATNGLTLAVPYVTTNAQGHVTGKGTHTHTVLKAYTTTATLSSGYVTIDLGSSVSNCIFAHGYVTENAAVPVICAVQNGRYIRCSMTFNGAYTSKGITVTYYKSS